MNHIECKDCRRTFSGNRRDARRDLWESESTQSQHAIDSGPMVCPDCVKQLIDEVLAALLLAALE